MRRDSFDERRAAFVTLRVRAGEPALRDPEFQRLLKRHVGELRQRYEEGRSFSIARYSVRDDHMHFVVEAADSDAMGRGMKSLATRIVRAANAAFDRSGPLMMGRYQVEYLHGPGMARKASAGCTAICRGPSKRGTHIRPGFSPKRPAPRS